MSKPDNTQKNDPLDAYIKNELHIWSVRQKPPSNGRARLLLLAASPPSVQDKALESLYSKPKRVVDQGLSDLEIDPFNHPWMWVLSLSSNPIRHLT